MILAFNNGDTDVDADTDLKNDAYIWTICLVYALSKFRVNAHFRQS